MKKIILILILLLISTNIYSIELENKLGLDEFTSEIESYIKDNDLEEVIDIQDIAKSLLKGEPLDTEGMLSLLFNVIFKEVSITFKDCISILIIIICISILNTLSLENKSEVSKIAKMVCFLTLATVVISNFLVVIEMLKNTVDSLSLIMNISTPFLLTLLLASGKITTVAIIEPIILVLISLLTFLITSITIPFLSLSLAFNIVGSLNERLGFEKYSKMFSNVNLWIIGIVFTIFIGIIELQTMVSTSVDSLAIKTTSKAVSNFIPVVR